MLITARASHLPHTPRKLKLVADAIRGKNVNQMLEVLEFTPKKAASSLIKVINQALGNAKNNFDQKDKDFTIKEIYVTPGRKFKRYHIGARGRYKPYAKLTSHLTIKLETKENKQSAIIKPKKKNGPKS